MKGNITLIGIIVVLLILCGLSMKTCSSERQQRLNESTTATIAINDSTAYYKDKYGREHAEKQQTETDLATARIFYGRLIDSVAKSLNINTKNIKQLDVVAVKDHNTVPLKIDTIYLPSGEEGGLGFSYKDRWIDLNGTLDGDSKLTYTTFDSLVLTAYSKKVGWFKSENYIDGYSINPHSQIIGITSVKLDGIKEKKFSLGVGVGYGFDGQKFTPNIGVSLQYSLIKF